MLSATSGHICFVQGGAIAWNDIDEAVAYIKVWFALVCVVNVCVLGVVPVNGEGVVLNAASLCPSLPSHVKIVACRCSPHRRHL